MVQFKTVTNIYTGELTDSAIVNAKEIEIIKKIVTKDDVVLDVGANIGFMTLQLAQLAKKVYAFEPSPDNFKQLEENTKHLDNVYRYEVATSDQYDDHGVLFTCPQDSGMNRMYPSKWCEGGKFIHNVMTITIDSIMLGFEKKISFIKLDVEGLEYRVIQGMLKLLDRDHPTLLMEWHPPTLEEAGTDPAKLYWFMRHELKYNNPINCNTNETIVTHNDLDKQTRDIPATNILWRYNK
jgi:FkbM family methyltransferase